MELMEKINYYASIGDKNNLSTLLRSLDFQLLKLLSKKVELTLKNSTDIISEQNIMVLNEINSTIEEKYGSLIKLESTNVVIKDKHSLPEVVARKNMDYSSDSANDLKLTKIDVNGKTFIVTEEEKNIISHSHKSN